ncbi:MAG TPA: hypothetical protein VLH10_25580, partial [Yinghuangia sp.]|nr:hypothetical protein [Yinghuangia sp.]
EPRDLLPLADGRLLIVDAAERGRAAGGVVVLAATGEYVTPWKGPLPPEDPDLREARERVGGLAAVRVPTRPADPALPAGILVAGPAGVHQVPEDGGPVELLLADGGFAGIAADRCGRVYVAGPTGVARLGPRSLAARGTAVFPAPVAPVGAGDWDRVRLLLAEPAPGGTHVRVYTLLAPPGDTPSPPDPASADVDADDAPVPTPAGRWRAGPLDGLDVRVLTEAVTGARLWIAVELLSGGRALSDGRRAAEGGGTPRLDDVRVEVSGRGLLDALPAVYTGGDDGSGTLGRFLGLLSAVHEDSARMLDELPVLLDPAVAPDRPDDPWLDRLAAWVAAGVPNSAQRAVYSAVPSPRTDTRGDVGPAALPAPARAAVAGAFAAHGRRGTPAGLVDAVARETGVAVTVSEPLLTAAVWRLGAGAGLGRDTAVRAADPGPPALDTTAALDAAALIPAQDRGLPLYAAAAHRVCVHVPPEHADAVPAITRVVERERPAHVLADVRTTRNGAIPGRIGVDTKVAAPPPAQATGDRGPALGAGARLPGQAAQHVAGPVGGRLDPRLHTSDSSRG